MNQGNDNINIQTLVKEKSNDGKISCAELFNFVKEYTIFPDLLGQCVTHENIKITHCQLGLFGYENKKKIVEPAENITEELENKIYSSLEEGILPCAASWAIAEEFKIKKMDVASACEKLKIKIKKCQLGAF
jgi:hypothetical protein